MSEIQEALSRAVLRLALTRQQAKHSKKQFADYKLNDAEFVGLEAYFQVSRDAQTEEEDFIRKLADEIYEEIGDKQPHPAITMKTYKGYEYDLEVIASWVKINLPALMVVDRKAFEAFLKTATDLPPGVTATATTKPTIKTNLDEYLEEAEDDFGAGVAGSVEP